MVRASKPKCRRAANQVSNDNFCRMLANIVGTLIAHRVKSEKKERSERTPFVSCVLSFFRERDRIEAET